MTYPMLWLSPRNRFIAKPTTVWFILTKMGRFITVAE